MALLDIVGRLFGAVERIEPMPPIAEVSMQERIAQQAAARMQAIRDVANPNVDPNFVETLFPGRPQPAAAQSTTPRASSHAERLRPAAASNAKDAAIAAAAITASAQQQ